MSRDGFFSMESPIYKFMSRLLDMLKLNFLWLLCSLPIVTMGASTAAAFAITLKMVDDEEGYILKPFLKEFKSNLKNGCIAGVINIIAVYAIYLDFQFFLHLENSNTMFLAVGVIAIVFTYMHFIYAYALMARYENTIINTLRNSFRISMRYFKKSIAMFLVIAVEMVVFLWNNSTYFLGILVGPACIILTISGMAKPIFRDIERKNEELEQSNSTSDE